MIVNRRFDHALNVCRNIREEVEACERLDLVNADAIAAPIRVDGVRVRHDDGDGACRGCYARDIVVAVGQDDDDLPGLRWRDDMAVGDGALIAGAAGDDVKLRACLRQRTRVDFQVVPGASVVRRGLRNHVGHQKDGGVVCDGGGAIRRRAHVSARVT